jgi:hypothetical protein
MVSTYEYFNMIIFTCQGDGHSDPSQPTHSQTLKLNIIQCVIT